MNIQRLLNLPFFYNLFQKIVGESKAKKTIVNEFIRPFPGAKILDIGCGTGSIRDYLPRNVSYFGVDINSDYIRIAKEKHTVGSEFICADISELNDLFPQNPYFDIAIAIGLLHHLDNNETINLLSNLYFLLKKDGFVITFDCVYIENQSKIAKFIISKDRGKHVRTFNQYMNLIDDVYYLKKGYLFNDLLRMPYNHCILKLYKKN